jgi:hypothetical protein
MTTLIHYIAMVSAALTLWIFFYDFLPWTTKLMATYGLHDLRDRLYDIGQLSPRLRETLIYRDAEFLLCVAISVVRDRDYRAAIGLASSFVRPKLSKPGWRREQYNKEIVSLGEEDSEHVGRLYELVDLALRSRILVLCRAIFGHPLPLLLATTGIGVAIANSITKLIAGKTPLELVGDAVSEIESRRTREGSVLELRHLITA